MKRILIGITACHKAVYSEVLSRKEPPNNSLCAAYSRKTWMKDAAALGVDVKFFFGRGGTREPLEDEIFLDCDDSYDGLVEKVRHMCEWAYAHGYDFLMKTDIDSYIHVANLLKSEFFEWDYAGRGWGLGYLLSRKAMRIVASAGQRLSWAEDSHVLRTLFSWGWNTSTPENTLKLYGDGRFVFLPNVLDSELPLYDKEFVVVNPMMPESMLILDETKNLQEIMPFAFVKEDLWVAGEERIQHSRVLNAFCIKGEEFPVKYDDWVKLTAYERQPYLDWVEIINACAETNQVAKGPTFKQWLGPIEHRSTIQTWARKVIRDSQARMQQASALFKANLGGV
jgi:hypothetical protein